MEESRFVEQVQQVSELFVHFLGRVLYSLIYYVQVIMASLPVRQLFWVMLLFVHPVQWDTTAMDRLLEPTK